MLLANSVPMELSHSPRSISLTDNNETWPFSDGIRWFLTSSGYVLSKQKSRGQTDLALDIISLATYKKRKMNSVLGHHQMHNLG